MKLILIGYRGTGKTSVARALGAKLGWPCFDSDAEVEQLAGRTIRDIFEFDGEEAFRDLESEVLARLLGGKEDAVVALGGGAILRPQNRQRITSAGQAVWLRATPETIARRLQSDPLTATQRPHLTPGGGLQEIRDVLSQREGIYQQCAAIEVDTENKDPQSVAQEIIDRFDWLS